MLALTLESSQVRVGSAKSHGVTRKHVVTVVELVGDVLNAVVLAIVVEEDVVIDGAELVGEDALVGNVVDIDDDDVRVEVTVVTEGSGIIAVVLAIVVEDGPG